MSGSSVWTVLSPVWVCTHNREMTSRACLVRATRFHSVDRAASSVSVSWRLEASVQNSPEEQLKQAALGPRHTSDELEHLAEGGAHVRVVKEEGGPTS